MDTATNNLASVGRRHPAGRSLLSLLRRYSLPVILQFNGGIQMATLNKAAMGRVTAATAKSLDTIDGAVHSFIRAFPIPTIAKEDPKAFAAAVQAYLTIAIAIKNGEKVELTDDDGKVLNTITPTDSVPTKSKKTAKNPDKKDDMDLIEHGMNMAKSLPTTYTELIDCIVAGLSAQIAQEARQVATQEFRDPAKVGKRGRKAAEVNPTDIE
jgi:hypothetical protein